MASSSSSSPSTWKYDVFTSFHESDVPEIFHSLLRYQLNSKGIKMFDDQGIERSQMIAPALTEAIRESKISIVVLSKNYASSSWCLDELLEILKWKANVGQIVMTIFYGVDPSHVRKQTGAFGVAFDETCARKTEEEMGKWRQALSDVAYIPGYSSQNWDTESEMIEKIARDILDKLLTTISGDFGDMVGFETHLVKMLPLLHLDNEDEAMIVGLCGPACIGKTTIARALHSLLCSSFQLTCFMENLRGSNNSGLDEYALKLGAVRERLFDKKVLIILDDVDDMKQLDAWDNEIKLFGHGSRIIVTTRDQQLLQKPGINDTYHVDLPSSEEARQILCKYAFGQRYPADGFTDLANRVVGLCGNLPSRLSEVGSYLCGRGEDEWQKVIRRLAVSNKRKSISIVMVFLVGINLLLEIASAVVEHLSSIRKPNLARISAVMSFLSVFLSILDLIYKILDDKTRFKWQWPIPWFCYRRIFGNFTDTVLLFCAVGGFIVSTVNWIFIEKRREGPIKASVWPLFFAIGLFGMVVYKFIQEKLAISNDYYPLEHIRIE